MYCIWNHVIQAKGLSSSLIWKEDSHPEKGEAGKVGLKRLLTFR